MIRKYKNFSVFKRKPKDGVVESEKAPGYDALTSYQNPDGTYEKSVTIGGVWLRDTKDGSKYYSAKLSDNRTVGDKTFDGWCIVNERELDNLILKVQKPDYPVEGIDDVNDPSEIPF